MKTYYLDYVRNKYKTCYGGDFRDCQKARADSFHKTEMHEIVQWGFDNPALDRNIVDTDFYNKIKVWYDRHLLGYYAWKPFVIYDLLKTIKDGDVVIYWDCNPLFSKFNCSFIPAIDYYLGEYDYIAGLQYGVKQRDWTKPECFDLMGCTHKKYWLGRRQIQCAWSLWKKTPKTLELVSEWLHWCLQENVIAHDVNANKNKSQLRGILREIRGTFGGKHRHDQSILTNLAVKHNSNVVCCRQSSVKLSGNAGKDVRQIMCNFEKVKVIQLGNKCKW